MGGREKLGAEKQVLKKYAIFAGSTEVATICARFGYLGFQLPQLFHSIRRLVLLAATRRISVDPPKRWAKMLGKGLLDASDTSLAQFVTAILKRKLDLSKANSTNEAFRVYLETLNELLPVEGIFVVSRVGLSSPQFRVVSFGKQLAPNNFWTYDQQGPVLNGGVVDQLLLAGTANAFACFQPAEDDPAFPFLGEFRSILAIPNYRYGDCVRLILLCRRQESAFRSDQVVHMTWLHFVFASVMERITPPKGKEIERPRPEKRGLLDFKDVTSVQMATHILRLKVKMSRVQTPDEVFALYLSTLSEMLPVDGFFCVSRLGGLVSPEFRVVSSSQEASPKCFWNVEVDDGEVLSGGILDSILSGGTAKMFSSFKAEANDPAHRLFGNMRSVLFVPSFLEGKCHAIIALGRNDEHAFDLEQLPNVIWLHTVFGQVTKRLVANRTIQRQATAIQMDINLLAELQRGLMPETLAVVPGIQIAAFTQPARSVGGDYYASIQLKDGRLGVFQADVSGHGIEASIITGIVDTLIHLDTAPLESPAKFMLFLNRAIAGHPFMVNRSRFITAFFGVVDTKEQSLTYSLAGHPPPRVRRKQAVETVADVGGAPLGIRKASSYDQKKIPLRTNEQLIMVTNGIIMATNPHGEMFGCERVEQALTGRISTPEGAVRHVRDGLKTFIGDQPLEDDISILALKME